MTNSNFIGLAAGVLTAALLVGCNPSEEDDGTLSLSVTDAPVDQAQHVWVQFSAVEVHGNGTTETFTFDEPKRIDLLALQGSDSAPLLENASLPSGHYEWMRLIIDADEDSIYDTSIVLNDGSEHELYVPSGYETGLKLVRGFDIALGGAADFTVDFDLRRSVVDSMHGYMLKPTLRLADNSSVAHIAGTVDGTLMSDNGCDETNAAVYVFSGADTAFDDVGSAAGPLASSLVRLNDENAYAYRLGYLEPGEYTLALTCEADVDDPDTDDAVAAVSSANATVTTEQRLTYRFEVQTGQ